VSTVNIDDLTQGNGPSVSQLPGPVSELMPAITRGVWIHSCKYSVSCENLNETRSQNFPGFETQQFEHLSTVGDEPGRGDSRWFHSAVTGLLDLPTRCPDLGVRRERFRELIVET
jgi:hypothetical protein